MSEIKLLQEISNQLTWIQVLLNILIGCVIGTIIGYLTMYK